MFGDFTNKFWCDDEEEVFPVCTGPKPSYRSSKAVPEESDVVGWCLKVVVAGVPDWEEATELVVRWSRKVLLILRLYASM